MPSTRATGRGSFYLPGLFLSLGALLSTVCQAGAAPALNGLLRLETGSALQIEVLRDDYQFAENPAYRVNYLPPFAFLYVQSENSLIPVRRGSIPGNHPSWEYMLEPGQIWQDESNPGLRSASLPFTLREYNADCMHNGILSFSIDGENSVSEAQISITSETCMYFKFNIRGSLPASFETGELPQAATIIEQFKDQQRARLIRKPIAALASKYKSVELSAFTGAGNVPEDDISTFGFVIDDVHYRGKCQTRGPNYRFCDDINLPSYSLAKTLMAGLAAMRLEKLYPGSSNAFIGDYVPQCRKHGNWSDVTFSQALNMLTGNYGSVDGRSDEGSVATDQQFFFKSTHADKVAYSCNAWPRSAPPGSQWVYHTTDTYILGSAMNALLREKQGADADIYTNLVLPLWKDLNLSPAIAVIRRTYDEDRQPFAGFGISLTPDNIARLATALNRGSFADQLDRHMFNSAMGRLPEPQGSFPADDKYYYSNGFWAYNAQTLLGCKVPVMVPFMSGYGGINVVMMPNDTVYYIFSDSGKFAFTDVIVQSHKIRSMCPTIKTTRNT
ncbi:MAG: serine hydrolase [Proteobacteria bacterium]|nr:serine hydrolase [Pseudomonadota bacterium]